MSETDNHNKTVNQSKNKSVEWQKIVYGLAISLAIIAVGIIAFLFYEGFMTTARRMWCRENLEHLRFSIEDYAKDHSNKYPTPNKWCDLLFKDEYDRFWRNNRFVCKAALKSGVQGRCHYAINPNCEPNSSGDVVLLFEATGGWNQFGGPELLSPENHKGYGCNILFNDRHTEFVEPKRFGNLKWKDDQNQ